MFSIFMLCTLILTVDINKTVLCQIIFENPNDSQQSEKCGISDASTLTPLLVDSIETQSGVFPWHAGLYIRQEKDKTVSWEQKCGGSLLTDQFVLTAAHCVFNREEQNVRVALGKVYRSWDRDEYGQQKRNVSKIIYPGDFRPVTYYFDIALLLLDEKVRLGNLVMPVCSGLLDGSNNIPNQKLFVVGWGQTDNTDRASLSEKLRYTDVKFLPEDDCRNYIPSAYVMFEKFCTIKNNKTAVSTIQPGDSGGGLTVVHGKQHYIIGIVSSKIQYFNNEISLFTNLRWHYHIWWIERNMKEYVSNYRWSENGKSPSIPDTPSAPVEGSCRLPSHPLHGAYTSATCSTNDPRLACRNTAGTVVPSNWLLKYTCNRGYTLNKESEFSVCDNGVWNNPLDCIKFCPPLKSLSVNVRCFYGGKDVACELPMRPDTTATVECKQHYNPPSHNIENSKLICLGNGEWSYPLFECTPVCGVQFLPGSDLFNFDGIPNRQGEFPWLAGLYYINSSQVWVHRCGGTLITPHIVLSAAHCLVEDNDTILPSRLKVGLGKYYQNFYKNESSSVISAVREVVVPRFYTGPSSNYALDIALVDLVISVEVTANIMPACIDWKTIFRPAPNAEGVVVGWERSSTGEGTVESARLQYIEYDQCLKTLRPAFKHLLTHDKLCAGKIDGGQDYLGGSGGGFTVVDQNGLHFLVGVVSTKVTDPSAVIFCTDIANEEHNAWLVKQKNRLEGLHRKT